MTNLRYVLIESFLDGYTLAGLFGTLRLPEIPVESIDSGVIADSDIRSEYNSTIPQRLDTEKAIFRFAMIGLCAGTALVLAVIGGFVYFVMRGHPALAGTLLGTHVFANVVIFVRAKRRNQHR